MSVVKRRVFPEAFKREAVDGSRRAACLLAPWLRNCGCTRQYCADG